MILKKTTLLLIFTLTTGFQSIRAQGYITVSGYVADQSKQALELTRISDLKSPSSTLTNENGFYTIQLPLADTVYLKFTCLSYQTAIRIIPTQSKKMQVNVTMGLSNNILKEVTIRGNQKQTNTFETLDASKVRLLPDASGGNIEALLVTFAGVSANNELSSQYSVRGGNYDENLVYVNGIEVYRPLLIRSGQQEGLSFINPEMVKEVKFSAGGFDARYGDKMSSVLDIKYKKPEKTEAVASVSLLGSNLYIGQTSKDAKFTQIHGIRYKTNAYLLGTLDTKGEYNPSFLDYQNYLTYQITPSFEISFLGNFSRNSYQFRPKVSHTDFGTYTQRYTFDIYFDGQERDLFETAFGALTLTKAVNKNLKLSIQSSIFQTREDENYDITGQYFLNEASVNNGETDAKNAKLIGIGTYHEHARNHLVADVFNISHLGNWKINNNEVQWGITYQREHIRDNIKEWKMLDSAGYTLPYNNAEIRLPYSMRSIVKMESNRFTGFLQDNWRFRNNSGLMIVTGGIRGNNWDFNKELLISPRASIAFIPNRQPDFTFRFATGIYYQAPFYKELRDTVRESLYTKVALNRGIKAQKTIQYVMGMDYQFTGFDRPFKFTIEAYYKDMSNLIPYTVDNVRIRYFGKNMGYGYTKGIDMKLFGEFVPGTDSWISLSMMKSHETIGNITVPRPNEQRYNISMFFRDYFPNNPKLTMSLKVVWADGLPFGPPAMDKSFATLRMPPYRRVDIGLSRLLVAGEDPIMKTKPLRFFKNIWIGLDCLNLLNTKNIQSYYWVTDFTNTQWAVANYLTGRRFNIHLTAEI